MKRIENFLNSKKGKVVAWLIILLVALLALLAIWFFKWRPNHRVEPTENPIEVISSGEETGQSETSGEEEQFNSSGENLEELEPSGEEDSNRYAKLSTDDYQIDTSSNTISFPKDLTIAKFVLSDSSNGPTENDVWHDVGEKEGIELESNEITKKYVYYQAGTDTKYYQKGTNQYSTLQEAIDSVSATGTATIYVIKSVTDSDAVTIPAGKTITLNTTYNDTNYTITKKSNGIVNKGTLKIKGSGTITTSGPGDEQVSQLIKNTEGGSIEISGSVKITNTGHKTSRWYAIYSSDNTSAKPGSITISGSPTLTASLKSGTTHEKGGRAILMDEYTSLTMSGGTVQCTVPYITGSNIEGSYAILCSAGTTVTNANAKTISVSGGTIKHTGYGSAIKINSDTGVTNKTKVNISGTTSIQTTSTAHGIHTNGSGTVTFSGGTISIVNGVDTSNADYNKEGIFVNDSCSASVVVEGGSITGSDDAILVYNGCTGSVTVHGGTLTSTRGSCIFQMGSGAVTIDNSKSTPVITSNSGGAAVRCDGGGEIKISAGTLTGSSSGVAVGGSSKITVSGGTITGKSHGINITTAGTTGTITVSGGTIIANEGNGIYHQGNGTLTIGTNESPISVSTSSPVIRGKTYAVNSTNNFCFYDGILKGATEAIYGGPGKAATRPTNYQVIYNKETIPASTGTNYETAILGLNINNYSVTKTYTKYYQYLSTAYVGCIGINNTDSSGTIVTVRSNTDTSTLSIASGKTITINTTNGSSNNTITKSTACITNRGTLNIIGSGKIQTVTASDSAIGRIIDNYGPLNLTNVTLQHNGKTNGYWFAIEGHSGKITQNSGKIYTTFSSGVTLPSSYSTRALEIRDSATFELINGSVETDVNLSNAYAIEANGTGANATGTIEIKGGTVKTEKGNTAITINKTASYATSKNLTISGGTVQGKADVINMGSGVTGTLTISGGNITSTAGKAITYASTGALAMSNGTITTTGGAGIYCTSTANISVSGGTIDAAGGCGVQKTSTGSITVTGGTIKSSSNSAVTCPNGTVTIGTNENPIAVSKTSPVLQGVNGMGEATTFNFYDGILKGSSVAIYGGPTKVTNKPSGYEVIYGSETISGKNYETAVLGIGNYSVTKSGSKRYYETLATAYVGVVGLDNATTEGTIVAEKDTIIDNSTFTVASDKDITINTNAKTIVKGTTSIQNNGILKINGGGTVRTNGTVTSSVTLEYLVKNTGTLTMTSVTVENIGKSSGGYNAIYSTAGTINVNSGATVRVRAVSGAGTSSYTRAIIMLGGTNVNVSGTVTNTVSANGQAIASWASNSFTTNGTITVNSGGTVSSTSSNAISIFATDSKTNGAKVVVNGGTVSTAGSSTAITLTKSDAGTTSGSITIKPNSTVTSTGGQAIGNGGSGNIAITGGTITGGTKGIRTESSSSGTIAISAGTITGSNGSAVEHYGSGNMTVSGSTTNTKLISTNGNAISTWSASSKLMIKGGSITTSTGNSSVYVDKGQLEVGEKGGVISKDTPDIRGRYAVEASNGFSFYDGILRGTAAGHTGGAVTPETNYSVVDLGSQTVGGATYAHNEILKLSGSISYATTSVTKTYGDEPFINPLTNTGDGTISYSSSNINVATVDEEGQVTILRSQQSQQPPQVTITATAVDGNEYTYPNKTASYTLTVNQADGYVTLDKYIDAVSQGTFSTTFHVADHKGGALSVEQLTSTVASVSISGTEITLNNLDMLTAGTVVRVKVNSAQNDYYTASSAEYKLTIGENMILGRISISGTPKYLQQLTAITSEITPQASYTYQWWYADSSSATSGTNFVGEKSVNLTLNDTTIAKANTTINGIVGKYIGVTVVATKTNYTSATFTATIGPVTRIRIASSAEPKASNKTYNGSSQTGVAGGTGFSVTGGSATDAGNYTATATLTNGYEWSNGSIDTKSVGWNISPKGIPVTWGTTTSFVYDGSEHAPTASASSGISGQTLVISNTKYVNVGSYTSEAKIDSVTGGQIKNYTLTGSTQAFTITKQTVNPPTNLAVSTAGVVTWTNSSNATGYEYSLNNSTFANPMTANSGMNLLSKLTETPGTKTIYVRAVNEDTDNYATPSASVSTPVNVFTITLASSDTNQGTVSPSSYNVISGVTLGTSNNKLQFKSGTTVLQEATATANTGFTFGGWSKTSGSLTGTQTITASFNSGAINFANQSRTVTYSTNPQTITIDEASGGTGNYSYTESSEKNASGTGTNYISISGTTITIAGGTPVNTYTYVVTAKDEYSNKTKDATITITVQKDSITGKVAITGTNTYGETLTAVVSDVIPEGCTLKYQWYSNTSSTTSGGTAISEATKETYTIGPGLAGKYIYVVVTASKENYQDGTFADVTDIANNGTATVQKAERALELDPTKTLTFGNDETLTYRYTGDDVTATTSSGTPTVATASILSDGDKEGSVKLHPLKAGTTEVTITIPESDNYKAISGVCTVTVNRTAGYITLNKTSNQVVYGTPSDSFTVTLHHGGALTVTELTNTIAEPTISGTAITISNIDTLSINTTVIVRVTSGQTDQYEAAYADYTLTFKEGTMTGNISIEGTPRYLETLVAKTNGIIPQPDSCIYQWWYADSSTATGGTNFEGQKGVSLILDEETIQSGGLTPAELDGKYIGVTVTAVKANYTSKIFKAITTDKFTGGAESINFNAKPTISFEEPTVDLTNNVVTIHAIVKSTSQIMSAKVNLDTLINNGTVVEKVDGWNVASVEEGPWQIRTKIDYYAKANAVYKFEVTDSNGNTVSEQYNVSDISRKVAKVDANIIDATESEKAKIVFTSKEDIVLEDMPTTGYTLEGTKSSYARSITVYIDSSISNINNAEFKFKNDVGNITTVTVNGAVESVYRNIRTVQTIVKSIYDVYHTNITLKKVEDLIVKMKNARMTSNNTRDSYYGIDTAQINMSVTSANDISAAKILGGSSKIQVKDSAGSILELPKGNTDIVTSAENASSATNGNKTGIFFGTSLIHKDSTSGRNFHVTITNR